MWKHHFVRVSASLYQPSNRTSTAYCINCAALLLKLWYCQKTTKFEKISFILNNQRQNKVGEIFFQNFVPFSEYLNFTAAVCIHPVLLGLFYTSTYILPRRMPRNAKFAHICISGKTCLRIELLNSPKQYLTSHRAYFILGPKGNAKNVTSFLQSILVVTQLKVQCQNRWLELPFLYKLHAWHFTILLILIRSRISKDSGEALSWKTDF